MSKSRRRKPPRESSQRSGRSGDPRRRAIEDRRTELEAILDPITGVKDSRIRAAARLRLLLECGDESDPLLVVSIPPLITDLIAAQFNLPTERCLTNCMGLVHTYAQLGIVAETRAAVLDIIDPGSGARACHGTLAPRWEDGLLHGHSVVWLPELRQMIDPTAVQYSMLTELDAGPIIIAEPPTGEDTGLSGDTPPSVRTQYEHLELIYTLASSSATVTMLDHPAAQEDYPRHGLNIASQTVTMLAEALTPRRSQRIPHRRVSALIEAVRDMPEHHTSSGDHRFVASGPNGGQLIVRLDEIRMPDHVPPVVPLADGCSTSPRY